MAGATKRLPLAGVKVLELSGLAPVPFAGMILADYGAQVTTISKPGDSMAKNAFLRGKRSICIDMKNPKGIDLVKRLNLKSDVLIEPFRPGVMEKLGLGPEVLCEENKRLIYVRLNGYGTRGCLSKEAGHDLNYLALSGILSRLGRAGEIPNPPINLLGDFGGGSLTAAFGVMTALFERTFSGKGQVVETSITEGTAYLSSFLHRSKDIGIWFSDRGNNLLDGGAPFYQVYETKDGKYMAVGCIEPQFFHKFISKLEPHECLQNQFDFSVWPHMKEHLCEVFKMQTQQEWVDLYADTTDACVTPVLGLDEAAEHPHNIANKTFLQDSVTGRYEPAPAPKLSRTPGVDVVRPSPIPGQNTTEVLLEEGLSPDEIQTLLSENILEQNVSSSL